MKTKEEVIKEAWGKYYTERVDENGWCSVWNNSIYLKECDIIKEQYDSSGDICRPKSLQGIENNNGWIKIESEKDLPKEDNKIGYLVIDTNKNIQFTNLRHFVNRIKEGHPYTHYQPINKPQPPLY